MLRRVACLAMACWLLLAPAARAEDRRLDAHFGIAESLTAPAAMADIGAGWTRVLLAWYRIQPRDPTDYSGFGRVLREPALDAEVARGLRVAAVLQYTPAWAAANPDDGNRAVPRNLYLPYDDPDNYWGQFVYQTVLRYSGRIEDWIIWNEPEFQRGEPGVGESYTWLGTEQDFAQLLKVGYLAAKRANPHAVVSFPATSYWTDAIAGRRQYYDRVLDILTSDPDAWTHNLYHDAVSINLYRHPDDLYRVHGLFKDIQGGHGIYRPLWLTETNAMPSDDRTVECWERHSTDPWQTTQQEQAAFAVQAFAIAAAAGYEHIAWWRMVDGRPCVQERLWGALRDDGSWRPAAEALRTAVTSFSGFSNARYTTTGTVAQVVFDRPGGQRVTVLWDTDSAPVSATLQRTATTARALDMYGHDYPFDSVGDTWVVRLPGATATYEGELYIGGAPVLMVENVSL